MRRYLGLILLFLLACDGKSNALTWKAELSGASVSTPLVTTDYIALGTENGVVILNRDGSRRCVFEQAGKVIAAPKTDGRSIFFGSTNYLAYAITPKCKERWSFSTGDRIKSDPLFHKGVVYFSSYDGAVYARNAKSGEPIWRFPERATEEKEEDNFEAVEKEEADTIYSVADEPRRGRRKSKNPPPKTGSFSYSSPLIVGNSMYIGNLDHRLYALDIRTGRMQWRFKTEAPVTSTPRSYDGKLYFGSNDGNVYALDIRRRKLLWKSKTQFWVNSSAFVEGDTLFIGSNDKNLYSLNRETGHALWSFEAKGSVVSAPIVYKDLIITAGSSDDGQVYAVNKSTGKLAWLYKTNGKIDSDPVLSGNQLFISSADGYLYAFNVLEIRKLSRQSN